MNKEGIGKGNVLTIIAVFIIIGFLVFVLAVNFGGEIVIPKSRTNHSGVINFTCNSTGIYGAINATLYYNSSGGPITTSPTYKMGNTSNWTVFGVAGSVENVNSLNISINTALFVDSTTYNISCTVCNLSAGTVGCFNVSGSSTGVGSTTNVTFDNTAPRVVNVSNPNQVNGFIDGGVYNGSKSLIVNVSINDSFFNVYRMDRGLDVDSVYINITNSTENMVNWTRLGNYTGSHYGRSYNVTVNIAGFIDGLYNLTLWVNETGGGLKSNNSEHIQFYVDNTAPTVTHTCSPSSVSVGQVVNCVCTGADATSGVNYTSDGTTTSNDGAGQIVTPITTTAAGTFTRTCTTRDKVGNLTSLTASYTVTSVSSGSTGPSGSTTTTPTTKTTTIGEIVPETPRVITTLDGTTFVKEITVEVSSTATNVQVTVNKYETKPAAVTVEVSNAYKYLQINTQNLADKLSKAIVKTYVEKSWVTSQGIAKEDVTLFKYDETANQWNELATTYDSEDANYYYYTTEVTSFSYFAIAPQAVTTPEGEEPVPEIEQPTTTGLLGLPIWAWIIIGLVILAAIIGGGVVLGKKKRR